MAHHLLNAVALIWHPPALWVIAKSAMVAGLILAVIVGGTYSIFEFGMNFGFEILGWRFDPIGWLLRGLAVSASLLVAAILLQPLLALGVSLFLDEIARVAENRYYPGLPPATTIGFLNAMGSGIRLALWITLANLFLIPVYLFLAPVAAAVSWAVNGYLFGREYFELVATRRLQPSELAPVWRQVRFRAWIAGILAVTSMALPGANLVVPVFGVALLTLIFHDAVKNDFDPVVRRSAGYP